ncbi:MAG: hypothetical protein JXQ66_01950 [Campylobacterales bacterium]|nr:hypothetical protein [Campylobacterales bacterium]
MSDKYLKILTTVLFIILFLLSYTLCTIVCDLEDTPKQKSTFKSTTPEGKLREISDTVK